MSGQVSYSVPTPKDSWKANCDDKPGRGMRVTISTKFGGGRGSVPFEVSVRVAQVLRELGCIVYNPNTDNKKGDGGWLLSFNESLDAVEASKGFIMQIQQGKEREKSDMQKAEEMNGKRWGVPKIGAFIPDDGDYREPTLRKDVWSAIQCARRQWVRGVTDDVENVEDLWDLDFDSLFL